MKMICTFFFFGLITFSQTGKMYLSYQIGQGYWGDGGVCPQRGVYDSPKKPVLLGVVIINVKNVRFTPFFNRILLLQKVVLSAKLL